jgi:hypothetical protein
MKKPKIIKHTGEFQSMIDKYRKSTNQILLRKKLDNSLNNYFLGELYNVKSKENFSDADYFINEIKFENKIKNKKEQNRQNKDNVPKISDNKIYTNKIAKDIFFYYKNQVNGKNKKNKKINLHNSERIKSPKSIHTINSAKRSNLSYKTTSDSNIILPLIYANNKYLTPSKHHFKTIANEEVELDGNIKSEKSERIKFSGRSRMENYLKYQPNYINLIDEKILLKKLHLPKNLLWKIKLPFVSNKIFNKVEEVADISENISKNINHLSDEGKTAIEIEKNRIKFLNNLMN